MIALFVMASPYQSFIMVRRQLFLRVLSQYTKLAIFLLRIFEEMMYREISHFNCRSNSKQYDIGKFVFKLIWPLNVFNSFLLQVANVVNFVYYVNSIETLSTLHAHCSLLQFQRRAPIRSVFSVRQIAVVIVILVS